MRKKKKKDRKQQQNIYVFLKNNQKSRKNDKIRKLLIEYKKQWEKCVAQRPKNTKSFEGVIFQRQ